MSNEINKESISIVEIINSIFDKKVEISEVNNFSTTEYNNSYLIRLKNNEKYFLKLGIKSNENEINEEYAYKNYYKSNLIYYQRNPKIILIKWLESDQLSFLDDLLLENLFKEIEMFHKIPLNEETSKINFYNVDLSHPIFTEEIIARFKKSIEFYKNDQCVFSHNDINRHNFISLKNKVTLVDFEWAKAAPRYFDYAQIIIAEGIPSEQVVKIHQKATKEKQLDHSKLVDYCFIVTVLNYSWLKNQPKSQKYEKILGKLSIILNKTPFIA